MTNKELLKLVTHKMGFVLPNAFLRGFMSAVFFLSGPPVPMKTHASTPRLPKQWAQYKGKSTVKRT